VLAISGAAFLIRRAVWEELGGFDESFFMYHEDTDISLRAALAGYRAVYVPEAVAWHDYAASFGPQKVFWLERNRYALLLKIFRWRTLVALAPALALAEIVTLGYAALTSSRHLRAKARAYAWLLVNVRSILRRRRATQASRTIEDRAILAGCTASIQFDLARSGSLARHAKRVFDPLFHISYWFALKVVRW
jgi:GT2 family glycosyltransferase